MPEEQNGDSGASLLDHLEAFRGTLLWCLGAVALMAVPGIIFVPDLLTGYVRYVCPPEISLHYFTPFEPLIVELELGLLSGLIAALPFVLWKLASFIAPGLYHHERRWGLFFIVSSVLLMCTGAVLALGAVIPIVMKFSLSFAAERLQPVIGLASFLHFAALLAGGFALVFELPIALLLAIRFGVVSVDTLRSKRPFIIVGLFIFAAVLTPPDVVSQLFMALPGWILFELTLIIGKRLAPKAEKEEEIPSYGHETAESAPLAEPCRSEEEEVVAEETPQSSCEAYDDSCADDADYRRAARKKRRIRPL